jgi:hypothetical protein
MAVKKSLGIVMGGLLVAGIAHGKEDADTDGLIFTYGQTKTTVDGTVQKNAKGDEATNALQVRYDHTGANNFGSNVVTLIANEVGTAHTGVFAEWIPTFSGNKLANLGLSGFVKDVGFGPEFELTPGSKVTTWNAISVQLEVPGTTTFEFKFGPQDTEVDGSRMGLGLKIAGAISGPLSYTVAFDFFTQEGDKDKVGENNHSDLNPVLWYAACEQFDVGLTFDRYTQAKAVVQTIGASARYNF